MSVIWSELTLPSVELDLGRRLDCGGGCGGSRRLCGGSLTDLKVFSWNRRKGYLQGGCMLCLCVLLKR